MMGQRSDRGRVVTVVRCCTRLESDYYVERML
jgi:hypothetical protein